MQGGQQPLIETFNTTVSESEDHRTDVSKYAQTRHITVTSHHCGYDIACNSPYSLWPTMKMRPLHCDSKKPNTQWHRIIAHSRYLNLYIYSVTA
jgi:hypothetical protein